MEQALVDSGCFVLADDNTPIVEDEERLRKRGRELAIEGIETMSKGKVITEIFEKVCEEKLVQPTFITEYPVEVSPLAKRSKERPEVTERFELYVSGMEIANGFNELNDPEDQKREVSRSDKGEGRRRGNG